MHLEVHVRHERVAGGADVADDIAAVDHLTALHVEAAQVAFREEAAGGVRGQLAAVELEVAAGDEGNDPVDGPGGPGLCGCDAAHGKQQHGDDTGEERRLRAARLMSPHRALTARLGCGRELGVRAAWRCVVVR